MYTFIHTRVCVYVEVIVSFPHWEEVQGEVKLKLYDAPPLSRSPLPCVCLCVCTYQVEAYMKEMAEEEKEEEGAKRVK